MKTAFSENIVLQGRNIDYRIVDSRVANKLRIRIGLNGVEVVKPRARKHEEVSRFLQDNAHWVTKEVERVQQLSKIRRQAQQHPGEILFNGEWIPVRGYSTTRLNRENKVRLEGNEIIIYKGKASRTDSARSLENWLRKQARIEIEKELEAVTRKIRRSPRRIYIMDQRTKWGNCSALQNLSFNWRLIMAPASVRRYLVVHEGVHLAVPDHSDRFWLTVKSLCPDAELAKKWLKDNSHHIIRNLRKI